MVDSSGFFLKIVMVRLFQAVFLKPKQIIHCSLDFSIDFFDLQV